MNEKNKKLLDAQEHPEQFTDETLRQMQDDTEIRDLMEATAQGKRALMKQKYEENQNDIDTAWQDFEAKNFPKATKLSLFSFHSSFQKMAATFIGILLMSGIVLAAIKSLTPNPSPRGEGSEYTSISDTVKKDTTPLSPRRGAGGEAFIFDNIPLDSILPQIAKHYGYTVTFRSEQPKSLRLFITWNPQDPIQKVTEKLNLFEHIHIVLDEQNIIVE